MNASLWAVQILLALAFIAAGGMKVFAYEKYKAMSEKKGPSNITRGLTTFIGIAELAGAFGVVLLWRLESHRGSARGLRLGLQPSCCWRLATMCAGASRRPRPPFSLRWRRLLHSGAFLTGVERRSSTQPLRPCEILHACSGPRTQ
jgi:DoxX-like family